MALSGSDLDTIRRFSRLPEYQAWLSVLRKRQAEVDAKLRTAVGEELHRQQGRAQLLDELLHEADEAAKSLNRTAPTRPVKMAPGAWPV